jgi:hypothetical protein
MYTYSAMQKNNTAIPAFVPGSGAGIFQPCPLAEKY